jgi:sulfur carrier protein
MNIKLNGEDRQIACGTVAELLTEMEIPRQGVAVEVNLKIVKKADYDSCAICEGDVVEIVNFVGGG